MSVYNHRPMVPAPQSRIAEMLDAIRAEFDQLSREIYVNKSERDNIEHKMNTQLQEMHVFQQKLMEFERQQQAMKKQYEDEIARLRQQLEQVQGRGGGSGAAAAAAAVAAAGGHSSSVHTPPLSASNQQQQPPPSIGPGSNYFGGIMNPHGNGSSSQGPPQVVAPPMGDQHPTTPHSGYPPAMQSGPLPPSSYIAGSNNQQGYGYTSRGPVPGTPSAISSEPGTPKRKPASSSAIPSTSAAPPMNTAVGPTRPKSSQMGLAASGALGDVDPESVPSNMKIEGRDWFALFNPKTPRYLTVSLMHSLDLPSVVCCVKFSWDGRWLAAGCNRATYIYDVQTARRTCVLEDTNVQRDGDLYIRSVCFSPDGKFLATGAEDKQIRIWDIAAARIRNTFIGHDQDIYSLDFSRDSRVIASGSGDRTIRLWSMTEQKVLHIIPIQDLDQKDSGVTSVAISPDSRLVAAGSLDKMVRVWDIHSGQLLERLEGHKDSVYSVAFMPDGRTLVSGSLDKTIKMWQLGEGMDGRYGMERDRSKGACKMTFTGHKDFVLSVACTPDSNWIVSGSKDRSVQFWDPRTGATQFMLQGHKNSVISVATSLSGQTLFATGSGDNRARIWIYEPL
ncbi:WD40-repeat-containing domain protein [Dichotomocladium elegans]|nr:WD40-repeat-containing domain protein [Dichotomocladium elegans]